MSAVASNVSIQANNLTIGYGSVAVQRNLTFSLRQGEMVALLGRNGSGKSTLLRTLIGMQPALSGQVVLDRGAVPAVVLTEHDTLDHTTVHDIVAMGRYPYTHFLGGLSRKDEQIIADSLRQVGMATMPLDRPFAAMSDGQKQRVLIAKALAQETDVILLDEPTSHLDIPGKREIFAMLQRLSREQKKTILISTHEEALALTYCDRVMMLYADGGGLSLGKPGEVRTDW